MLKTSVNVEHVEDRELFAETLRLIKGAGFEAVDAGLFSGDLIRIMRSPSALSYAKDIRMIIEDSGLEVGQCHMPLCGTPDDWPDVIEATKYALPFAAAMGAKNPVIHPIRPMDLDDPRYGKSFPEMKALNEEMFRIFAPIARDCGLNILIENLFVHGRSGNAFPCYTSHAEELNELMDLFPGMGICLDTGHVVITGQESADLAYGLGHRVRALHLHGNNRIGDLHLPPFETEDLKWENFCAALKAIGYEGTINLEVLGFIYHAPEKLRAATYSYLHACAQYLAEMVDAA